MDREVAIGMAIRARDMYSRELDDMIRRIKEMKRSFAGTARSMVAYAKKVAAALKAMRAAIMKLRNAFRTTRNVALKAFTAIVALTTIPIYKFAKFEQAMANVNTLLDVSREKFTQMRDEVIQVSNRIGESAETLSTALYDIVSSGVKAASSINVLSLAAKAAKAGMTQAQTAVKAGMATINAFDLAITDLNSVFDLQFQTVRKGVITYEQLANAQGQLLPSARKLNESLENMYGSLAFVTKQGLSAELASVSLARAYDGLIQKSGQLADAGINVYDEFGNFRGIVDIVEDLSASLEGLTDEQMQSVLENVGFEIRAARAIIPMIKNIDGLRESVSAMNNSTGAMQEAFRKAIDTIAFHFNRAKENVVNAVREMGSGWNTEVNNILDSISAWAGAISTFVKNNKEAIKSILTFAIKLTATVTVFATVGLAILSLATTTGQVAAGIAILAAAWYLNLWDIRDITANVVKDVKEIWDTLKDWWNNSDLAQLIRDIWNEIVNIWTDDDLTLPEKTLNTINLTAKTVGKLIESIMLWWTSQTINLVERGAKLLGLNPDDLWITQFLKELNSIWLDSTLTFSQKTVESLKLIPGGQWLLDLVNDIKEIWKDESLSLPDKIIGVTIEVFVELWKGGQKIVQSFWDWIDSLFESNTSIEERIERYTGNTGLGELLKSIYTAEGGENASVLYGMTRFRDQGYKFAKEANQEFFNGLTEALNIKEGSDQYYAAAAATSANHYWQNFKKEYELEADTALADLSKEMRQKFVEFMGSGFAPPDAHELNPNWDPNVTRELERNLQTPENSIGNLDLTIDFTIGIGAITTAITAAIILKRLVAQLIAQGVLIKMGAQMAAGSALTAVGGSALALASGLTIGATLSVLFDPEVTNYEEWKKDFKEGMELLFTKQFWQDLWTIAQFEWKNMIINITEWSKEQFNKIFSKEYWLGVWDNMKQAWKETWADLKPKFSLDVQREKSNLWYMSPLALPQLMTEWLQNNFATGGYVSGPGTATSDSIPAMLSNGEFVINAQAAKRWRPFLEAINSGNVPGFKLGGQLSYQDYVVTGGHAAANMQILSAAGLSNNKLLNVLARISKDTEHFKYLIDIATGFREAKDEQARLWQQYIQDAEKGNEILKQIRDNLDPTQPAQTKTDWNNFLPLLADLVDTAVEDFGDSVSQSTAALISGVTGAMRSFSGVNGGFFGTKDAPGVIGELKTAWSELKGGNIRGALGSLSQGTVQGITAILDGVKNAIISGVESAAQRAAQAFQAAAEKFQDAVNKFDQSISQSGSLQMASYDYQGAINQAKDTAQAYAESLAAERRKNATRKGAGIGGLLGGVIGFFVGGPAGAAIGAGIGGAGGAAVGAMGDYYRSSDYQKKLNAMMKEVKEKMRDTLESAFDLSTGSITGNINQAILDAAGSGKDMAKQVGISLYGQVKSSLESVFLWANNNLINEILRPMIGGMKDKIIGSITSGDQINFDSLLDINKLIQVAQKAEELGQKFSEFRENLRQRLVDAGLSDDIIDAIFPVSQLSQNISEALRGAMGTALESGDYRDFTKSMGQSIYDNARQGLIQAFMESEVYQRMFAQWFDTANINFSGNLEQDFGLIQNMLTTLQDRLRSAGLDFNYTRLAAEGSAGTGGTGTIESDNYYAGADTSGNGATTINNKYIFAPHDNMFFGSDKEDLFREFEEWRRKKDDDSA